MKFAYLIVAHNEFEILEKLMRLLDDPRNDIFLHIDSKAKNVPDRIRRGEFLKQCKLTVVPSKKVTWGGFNLIARTVELLEKAVKQGQYDYYHLISGVDLPLHKQDEIHSFFEKNKGKEFVGTNTEWANSRIVAYRYQVYHPFQDVVGRNKSPLFFLNRIIVKSQGPFVNRQKQSVSGGPEWFSITDEFAKYIISRREDIAKQYRYTLCGDEHFVQTILINSRFKGNQYLRESDAYEQCVRYIDFNSKGDLPGSPKTLLKDDVISLIDNPKFMFARKFSTSTEDRKKAVDYIFDMLN